MRKARSTLRIAVVASTGMMASFLSTPAAHALGSTSFVGPLSVQGNRIVDAQGSTVVLRGLQRDGTQGGPGTSPVPVTADELSWLTTGHSGSWQADVIRIPLGSAQWTGACPKLASSPSAYRAGIDAEVASITMQHAVALIDLHTSTAGCASIARHAMPDAPVTQTFWRDVATHYATNDLVAFELYNEPHFVPDAEWLNGTSSATAQDCDLTVPPAPTAAGRVQQQSWLASCQASMPKYQAVGMQELYDLVVRAAPGHLVVIDGTGWGTTPSSLPVNAWAGQLVYAVHPYTCPTPGSSCDTTQNAVANLNELNRWTGVSSSTPVMVTEMGWPVYPSSDTSNYVDGSAYYAQTLAFLQAQSPRWGFVAFAFDGTDHGAFALTSNLATYAPNTTGQPVFYLLKAAALA
jgi:hypothetical protein